MMMNQGSLEGTRWESSPALQKVRNLRFLSERRHLVRITSRIRRQTRTMVFGFTPSPVANSGESGPRQIEKKGIKNISGSKSFG
jgi:hypothetical protein